MNNKFLNKKIKSPIKKLKWGVAGCGRYVENSFLPSILLLRRSVVKSVFSHQKERAQYIADKYSILNRFNNYEKFLSSDIDVVYIASSNNNHFKQVIKAAEAGKHILCEKPIALSSKEAEEMVAACEMNKVQFAVNYTMRFHPIIIKAKEIIESRKIGKLTSINMNFNIKHAPSENFRYNKKLSGGGVLRDLGTHLLDLLCYFGGEIESINGVLDNLIYHEEVEDFASCIIKFKTSGYGMFNVSYNNKRAFNRIEILGSNGAVSIENFIASKKGYSKIALLIGNDKKRVFRKRSNKIPFMLRSVQKSFLKNVTPLVSGKDGLKNLQLMEELESKCF